MYSPSIIARQFAYVRESDVANHGIRVEAIQHWSKGQFGDSWCCEFATMVLDICFQGNSPIPRGGSCQDVYDLAKAKGWVVSWPLVDDLFLYVNDNDHAHHIGIVTRVEPLINPIGVNVTGIAGNTSKDGTSSNGDGVYEHGINAHVFVRYPR